MDEIRDMEVETIEEEMDCEIPEEEEGSGIATAIKVVAGLGTVMVAGAGLRAVARKLKVKESKLWHKIKDKIEKWQASRLAKKGYVVYKPDEDTPVEDTDESNAD